jgi:hypothetical protein
MSQFYYSTVKASLDPDRVETDLRMLNVELWGPTYRVDRSAGVPATPEDTRQAFWCFTHTDPAVYRGDAAFSITLLKDGRLEFKVPRSQWDACWEDQQKIRRRLVRLYNATV